jgi:hypothetical protein
MVSSRPRQSARSRRGSDRLPSLLLLTAFLASVSASRAAVPAGYPGTPYQGKVQDIPGRVFLSDFDQGPKNVVWHDYETRNQWACKVRDSTGVGLQIMGQGGDKGDTKEADSLVKARIGKCYLAQTNTGDWTKYTVKVAQAGTYTLAMLTAAQGTTTPFVAVSLLSDKDSAGTGKLTLPLTTYFHNWVYTRSLASLSLDTGLQVLRFDIPGNGPMNIDYIDFARTGASALEGRSSPASPEARLSLGSPSLTADGGIRLSLRTSGGGPVLIRAYDAAGGMLAEAMVIPGGAEEVLLRPSRPVSGLVFLKSEQGRERSLVRAFLTAP